MTQLSFSGCAMCSTGGRMLSRCSRLQSEKTRCSRPCRFSSLCTQTSNLVASDGSPRNRNRSSNFACATTTFSRTFFAKWCRYIVFRIVLHILRLCWMKSEVRCISRLRIPSELKSPTEKAFTKGLLPMVHQQRQIELAPKRGLGPTQDGVRGGRDRFGPR